jgi:hypothetical protein
VETEMTNNDSNPVPERVILPNFRIAGIKFHHYESHANNIKDGTGLELRRDASNEFDPNAVAVYHLNEQIGYVEKNTAKQISKHMDNPDHTGFRYAAIVIAHDVAPDCKDYDRIIAQGVAVRYPS